MNRLRSGRFDVTATMADLAIVTYTVEPDALSRFLAPGFVPNVRTFANGSRRALVSVVPFRYRAFQVNVLPRLRMPLCQINYRAYVLYGGKPCVWFFGQSMTRPFNYLPSLCWKLPLYPAAIRLNTQWEGNLCRFYEVRSSGSWGPLELGLEGSDEPMGALDGFSDEEETSQILTHPLAGYYYRRDGRVGELSIWHDSLRMQRAYTRESRVQLFEELGLVRREATPHSALLQRETEFLIRLPPRIVQ